MTVGLAQAALAISNLFCRPWFFVRLLRIAAGQMAAAAASTLPASVTILQPTGLLIHVRFLVAVGRAGNTPLIDTSAVSV
jgi:hypothetical protein